MKQQAKLVQRQFAAEPVETGHDRQSGDGQCNGNPVIFHTLASRGIRHVNQSRFQLAPSTAGSATSFTGT